MFKGALTFSSAGVLLQQLVFAPDTTLYHRRMDDLLKARPRKAAVRDSPPALAARARAGQAYSQEYYSRLHLMPMVKAAEQGPPRQISAVVLPYCIRGSQCARTSLSLMLHTHQCTPVSQN